MSNDSSSTTKEQKPAKQYAWGPAVAVVLVLGCFLIVPTIVQIVLSFVPSILGWSASRAHEWATDMPIANFLFVLFTEILTIAAIYAFIHSKKIAFTVATAMGKPRIRDVGYAIIGLLAYFGLFTVIYAAITQVINLDNGDKQALGFEQGVSGPALWMAFFSLVILPPITEEIIFRGFFYGTLRNNKVRKWPAILVTTTLFAALHLFGGGAGSGLLWAAFVDVFTLSIVLCYLREETGSIWASMGVHALKNGFVFINLFLIQGH